MDAGARPRSKNSITVGSGKNRIARSHIQLDDHADARGKTGQGILILVIPSSTATVWIAAGRKRTAEHRFVSANSTAGAVTVLSFAMFTDAHRNILTLMKAAHVLTTITEHGHTRAFVGDMAIPPEIVDDLKAEGFVQLAPRVHDFGPQTGPRRWYELTDKGLTV